MKYYFLAILPCLVLASCNSKIENTDGKDNEEIVTVKLATGGELDVTYNQMTKAVSGKGMAGIQIFRTYANNGIRKPYAYGVFTDINNLEVSFVKGDTYDITIDYVVDADYYTISGTNNRTNVCLEIPFNTRNWSKYNIDEFTYSTEDDIHAIGGNIYEVGLGYERHAGNGNNSTCNTYDRYYGKLKEFKPEDNGTATVPLLHMSSSLTVTVSVADGTSVGDDLVLYFSNLYNNGKTFPFSRTQDDKYVAKVPIFTVMVCENYYESEDPDQYATDIDLKIGTQADRTMYYDGKIAIKRNMNINATYTIQPINNTGNNINATYEDTAMGNTTIAL